jgi:uncharacterized membrane protein
MQVDKAMAFDCNPELYHIDEIVLALTNKKPNKKDVKFGNKDRTWMLGKSIIYCLPSNMLIFVYRRKGWDINYYRT